MKIRFDTSPVSAQQSNGLAVRYAAAKREVPRWRWYLMLAVIGVPLLYFLWRFVVAVWWETAPGFVVVPTLTIKAAGAGTVREIVASGSAVERGTTLLTVEAVAPRAPPGAAAASASVASAVGASAPLLTSTPPPARAPSLARTGPAGDDMLALLGQATQLGERTLAYRRERLANLEALKRDAAATQAEVDAARAAVVQAESDLLRARTDVQARRQALIDQARAALAAGSPDPSTTPLAVAPVVMQADSRPGVIAVSSPFAGTVSAVLVVPGEYVTPSTEVMLLQGREMPTIEAYVAPSDARYAKVGRRASLQFFDGKRVGAIVTEVSGQTARIPAERVGPLSARTQAILVRLRPEQELPARYRINVLPLDVRFDSVWPWSE